MSRAAEPRTAPDALALRRALAASVERQWAPVVLLSGGPDCSIVAWLAQRVRPVTALTVSVRGAPNADLPRARAAAAALRIPLIEVAVTPAQVRRNVPAVIGRLKTFLPAHVRTGAVLWEAWKKVRALGHRAVMTGDGADELFVGYDENVRSSPRAIAAYRARALEDYGFAPNPLAEAFGLELKLPFVDDAVVRCARRAPLRRLVRERHGRKLGKWLLREAFDGLLPDSVVWRPKMPFGRGSGISGMRALGAAASGSDGIRFADRETARFQALFRRRFGPPGQVELVGGVPFHRCRGKRRPLTERFCPRCGAWWLF